MNIEGVSNLPDGVSLADKPLRQFCLLGVQLGRASKSGHPATEGRRFLLEINGRLPCPRRKAGWIWCSKRHFMAGTGLATLLFAQDENLVIWIFHRQALETAEPRLLRQFAA